MTTTPTEGKRGMSNPVSNEVADRIRAFAWRIRPQIGPDHLGAQGRNGGRGLGDTIAMIIAAGHRNRLTSGSNHPYGQFDADRHRDGIEILRSILRNGGGSGPAGDISSLICVADETMAWVAPDGTVVCGPMQDGGFLDHSITIVEDGEGDWAMTMQQAVPDPIRRAVAADLATRIAGISDQPGKVTQRCGTGGILLTTERRIDHRGAEEGLHEADFISDLIIRHDPEALEQRLDGIAHEMRSAWARHAERMAQMRDIASSIEGTLASRGFHTRLAIRGEPGEWIIDLHHLGIQVAGTIFERTRLGSMKEVERHLKMARQRSWEGSLQALMRFDPDSGDIVGRDIDASLLLMVHDLSEDPDTDLRRIAAHGTRSWSAQDLSDMFGRDVNATLAVDIEDSGRVRAIIQLSSDITLKRGILVIRRNQLPQTIVQTLAGRRVRDVVSHRWMPDVEIVRLNASAGAVGDTYSITLADAYGRAGDIRIAA